MSKSKENKVNTWIKKVFSKFTRTLYPEGYVCYICGAELDEEHRAHSLCEKCLKRLPFRHDMTCPVCGTYVTSPGKCIHCRDNNLPYHKAYAPFDYTGSIRYMIISYKDKGSPWLHTYISKFLIDYAKAMELKADYLVYVPSSAKALKTRGFEHNKQIAEAVADALDMKLTEPLHRISQKKDNRNLSTEDRFRNVAEAFQMREDYDRSLLIGKSVLIIDDVMSSGATVTTCASILKRNGAKEINILTLARS